MLDSFIAKHRQVTYGLNKAELSRELGVSYAMIQKALNRGMMPLPDVEHRQSKYWSPALVKKIKELDTSSFYANYNRPTKPSFNVKRVAQIVGISESCFIHALNLGILPSSDPFTRRYTRQQVEEIKAIVNNVNQKYDEYYNQDD